MEWKEVNKQTPNCYETGDWDGKKSDEVLCSDIKGNCFIAIAYEGTMDGSHFLDWYDKDDYEIKNEVAYWAELTDPRMQ